MKTEAEVQAAITDLKEMIKRGKLERVPTLLLEMIAFHAAALEWVMGNDQGLFGGFLDRYRSKLVEEGMR